MPAAATNKKYKLFSATVDGAKQPCAFFLSDKGCRNGDKCKFAHIRPHEAQAVVLTTEMVSSEEEESEGEQVIAQQEAKVSVKKEEGEIVAPPHPFVKRPADIVSAAKTALASTGKKGKSKNSKKRSDSSHSDSPFAAPKSKKQKKAAAATAVPKKDNKQPPQQQSSSKSPAAAPPPPPPPPNAKSGPAAPSFRTLDLPIASFSTLATVSKKEEPAKKEEQLQKAAVSAAADSSLPAAPLPTATETGRKWLQLVQKTREHPRYQENYDLPKYKALDLAAGYAPNTWVSTHKFDPAQHSHLPQCIALDCEMCETVDPVSGAVDPRALCRISVVDAEKDEVLLDSLVKPQWPVRDHRTWINGIAAQHLEPVQFTLRHAQAFFRALCSDQTVLLGHAVHNDLAALRLEHVCVVDSACLFRASDSETATVSLRDLASSVLQKTMPDTHDSVNDARVALRCLEHYRTHGGVVDKIVRTPKSNQKTAADYAAQLFVHRIPRAAAVDETQLAQMFVSHTHVQPESVDDIDYSSGSSIGKTIVHFASGRHGDLAFDSLDGRAVADASGRLQKKVYLRNGNYIRVRKMAFEPRSSTNQNGSSSSKDDETQQDCVKHRLSS